VDGRGERFPNVCCWRSQGQYVTFTFKRHRVDRPASPWRYSAGNGDAHRSLQLDG